MVWFIMCCIWLLSFCIHPPGANCKAVVFSGQILFLSWELRVWNIRQECQVLNRNFWGVIVPTVDRLPFLPQSKDLVDCSMGGLSIHSFDWSCDNTFASCICLCNIGVIIRSMLLYSYIFYLFLWKNGLKFENSTYSHMYTSAAFKRPQPYFFAVVQAFWFV